MSKQVAKYLIGRVKGIYKSAVDDAKRGGRTATMYKEAATKVMKALSITDEMVVGEDPFGVLYADMKYIHVKRVPKVLEDGSTVYEDIPVEYGLKSSQTREGRCSLSPESGNDSQKIAEVSK